MICSNNLIRMIIYILKEAEFIRVPNTDPWTILGQVNLGHSHSSRIIWFRVLLCFFSVEFLVVSVQVHRLKPTNWQSLHSRWCVWSRLSSWWKRFSKDIEIVRDYLPVSVGERSWDPILAPGSATRISPLFLSAVRLVE